MPYRRRRIGRHCNRSDRPYGQPCRINQPIALASDCKGFRLNVTDSTVPLGTNQVYETSLTLQPTTRIAGSVRLPAACAAVFAAALMRSFEVCVSIVSSRPLKVTLVWTDPAASPLAGVRYRSHVLHDHVCGISHLALFCLRAWKLVAHPLLHRRGPFRNTVE